MGSINRVMIQCQNGLSFWNDWDCVVAFNRDSNVTHVKLSCYGLLLFLELGSHSSSSSNELLPPQSGSWNKVDTARSTYDLASIWAQYKKQQKWRHGYSSGGNDASWGLWTYAWIRSKTVQPHGRRLWTSVNKQPLINMLRSWSILQITSEHHMYHVL